MIDEKSIQANNGFKDPAGIPEGYVFRDQRGRYPWWVKSVDRITTPVDVAASAQPACRANPPYPNLCRLPARLKNHNIRRR
jgi:hypothetical protein